MLTVTLTLSGPLPEDWHNKLTLYVESVRTQLRHPLSTQVLQSRKITDVQGLQAG